MNIKCVKNLVMDDGELAFLKGKTYKLHERGGFFVATNEQGNHHYFDGYGQDDWNNWFDKEDSK